MTPFRTLAVLFACIACAGVVRAQEKFEPKTLDIGAAAPDFKLKGVDDRDYTLASFKDAKVLAVVFTTNHCPTANAYEQRMIDLHKDYAAKGVAVVAINPNDPTRQPKDSVEHMHGRVAAGELGDVPYLHDETQEVARSYAAKTTPDVFVLDGAGVLRYRGALDAAYDDEAQNAAWVRSALDAILAGRDPDPAETAPVGCSVKWRAS